MLYSSRTSRKVLSVILICSLLISMVFVPQEQIFAKSKKPGKIKKIKVSATEKTAKITWSKSKAARKYQVVVKLGKKTITNKKSSKRSFKLKNLKQNKKYTVYIRGINGKKKGKWKKKIFVTKKASEPQKKPEKNDETVTIGNIEDMIEAGTIDAGYNDGGNVEYIYGQFTEDKVDSVDSAIEALDNSSKLIDQSFSAEDCQVSSDETSLNSTVYRFKPSYEGIPIEGGSVILESNDSGDVQGLYNTYDSRINWIDIDEDFDYDYAEYIALQHMLNNDPELMEHYGIDDIDDYYEDELIDMVGDDFDINAELIIYCTGGDEQPFLAYKVKICSNFNSEDDNENVADFSVTDTNDDIPTFSDEESDTESDDYSPVAGLNYTYYIYANGEKSEEIYLVDDGMRGTEGWKNITAYAKDELNKSRKINAQKYDNSYKLVDTSRKLYTYRANNIKNGRGSVRSFLPGNIVVGTALSKKSISTHANMSDVYDFYSKIGRKSFDGKGGIIKVSYDFANNKTNGYYNAFWDSSIKQMVFGNKGNYERALDVTGHEFTHAVISNTADLEYSGESGALNEAYADIMGQLIEGKDGKDEWLIAEDALKAIRSLKNPGQYKQPSIYSDFKKTKYDADHDYGGVHTNSGIFNHAAYLMMNDKRTANSVDRYRWGKLFLNALDRMSERTSFLGARYAIVSTAKKMKFSENELHAINQAFEDVGITVPKRIRISMRWGAYPEDLDLHIVGPTTAGSAYSRFHVYFEDLQYIDHNDVLAADLDHDDIDSYGPEVATIRKMNKGTYYIFVHDYTNRESMFSNELSTSNVEIRLFSSDERIPFKTYNIPLNRGGTYWNVCKITIDGDGIFTVGDINTFSYDQDYN